MLGSPAMADVKPFRAVRYGERAGPLEALVAPPYDVISPDERERLGARSPYNVVHLTLPDDEAEAGRPGAEGRAQSVPADDQEPASRGPPPDTARPDGGERTRAGPVRGPPA